MQYGELVSDQVVYHLPPGLTVEGAPQDAQIPWVGHAVLVSNSQTDPGQITIARHTRSRLYRCQLPGVPEPS
jgi:hypothetical protein